MPCHSPKRAFQVRPGAPVSFAPPGQVARVLELPCGRCQACRLERSRQDAVRCVHEAQMHERNAFVTLTYDDAHLPPGLGLVKRDWQLFMKRLRKRMGVPIRFFMCGEYGEQRSRPHYHACLFGCGFDDRYYWRKSEAGFKLYRSELLERTWGLGSCEIGDVSFESAAYVARYIMQKELGLEAGPRRCIVDVTSGEMLSRAHEFSLRSLKPGIGLPWLLKFASDVYPHGSCVVNAREVKPPRYYDKWFALQAPEAHAELLVRREREAAVRFDDGSPARLRVKAKVLSARVSLLKRSV